MLNKKMKQECVKQMPILEIKTANGNKLIQTTEILYIQANNKHTSIRYTDGESIVACLSLKFFEEKLPKPIFYRCHDSYMVNCLHVDCICKSKLLLLGNIRIPVSRSKKQELKDNFERLHKLINELIYTTK